MTNREIVLSAMVHEKAAQLGAPGTLWLVDLPRLVTELERRWAITVGPALSGGTTSFVARARTADGRGAVLKIAMPGPEFVDQLRTLAAARGHGYVRVLAHDVSRHAMLQEALGPSMLDLTMSAEQKMSALCQTLAEAWTVPPPTNAPLLREENKAVQLADMVGRLWERLEQPCSERVVARALECARRRAAAFDASRVVVVHGDPHPGNALQVLSSRAGVESGFVFVDPEGFLADPAYDLGVVLRDWCPQILHTNGASRAHRYCHLLATETGLDETAIWEWGYLERVSSALYLLSLHAPGLAQPFFDTAELLL